jgi:hypothetical protein
MELRFYVSLNSLNTVSLKSANSIQVDGISGLTLLQDLSSWGKNKLNRWRSDLVGDCNVIHTGSVPLGQAELGPK